MPWLETDPVTERKRFIMEWLSGDFAVAELCRRHEISRKTGYKWIARYEREGPEGLEDRSKRPGNCPGAVEPGPDRRGNPDPLQPTSDPRCPKSSPPARRRFFMDRARSLSVPVRSGP